MGSKVWIWKKIPGLLGRCNDVLYTPPQLQPTTTQDLLIFFGGDVQDTQENMEKHPDRKYKKWCLENTTTILSNQFPKSHIFVVRPARMSIMRNAVFSCFDNFVLADEYGTPTFCLMHQALKHLRLLLFSCLELVKTLNTGESIDYNFEEINLSLMGFSKGCAVLNQFLYEFHYYHEYPNQDTDINNFIKCIKDMWWLDGGHNGPKNTWITEKNILQSFAKLRINTHIHVTPYQMQDLYRPWIRMEENCFNENLRHMEVPVQRVLHFGNKDRSLSLHFNVLTNIVSNQDEII